MATGKFWGASFFVAAAVLVLTRGLMANEYFFFAGYVVLQYIVLATAWNILGGYTGYTNFGVGAFFAVGAYSSVVLHKLTSVPVPVMILVGGLISGILGFGMGYLTLRLKGVFFAIATLALAIVAQTLIVNWDYVGGSRGIYVIRPQQAPLFGSYIQYLYSLMLILAWVSVAIARTIERSRLGLGFNAIRDDEAAAEAGGVPTLRLKGVFFAIATLALAIVAQTLIVNWDYVGGSRGIYVIRPQQAPLLGSYIQYLYSLMLVLAWIAVAIARTIERSRLGLGFNAIRDDEAAAEAGGVPTLRLKLISTTLSGALMGMSGAPLPYYVTYLDPASSFNLSYAVNSVAMPLIGGMTSWAGPVIGAILLGTIQQLATVTISSALNLLIVGLLLIAFVIIAPNGIVGLVQARRRARLR